MELDSRPEVAPPASAPAPAAASECLPRPLVVLSSLLGVPPCRPQRRPLATLSRGYSLLVAGGAALLGYVAAARSSRGYHMDCYSYYGPHIFTHAVITVGGCACHWLDTFVAELRRVDDLLGVDQSAADRATGFYAGVTFAFIMLPYLGGVVWDVLSGADYNVLTVVVIVVIVVAFEQFFVLGLVLRNRLRFLNDTVEGLFTAELEAFSVLDKATVSAQRRLPPSHLITNEITLNYTTLPPSCEHLLTIKIAHMKLTKLAGSLNNMYSVPVTSTAVQAFVATVQVIFDILLILLVQDPGNDTVILTDVCFLVMNMMIMLSLAYCCESITSEARRTAVLAENLILANETAGGSEAVRRQLGRLSAQARHSPVMITACSLFPFDASLLTAFTSYVATYTIILLKFVVSNSGCSSSGHVTDSVNVTTSSEP